MNKRGEENRSVRHTRMRIHGAMVELLKKKPVSAITVRELAELADVNRSTFYLHYRDVYDLLEQMEQSATREFQGFLDSKDLQDLTADGIDAMQKVFAHLYDNRERFLVIFGPNGRKEALELVVENGVEYLVNILTKKGGFQRDLHLELGIRFMMEGAIGVMRKHYFDKNLGTEEELVTFFTYITNILFRGYQQM